ncbi:MAG: energy transducer TonB [Bacteroidota bacterium]|nr:energy transducer TonB [Bacteroidota bacterium]
MSWLNKKLSKLFDASEYYNLTEVIFENRNKEYGAYKLRKEYHRNLALSTATVLAAISLYFLTVWLIHLFDRSPEFDISKMQEVLAEPLPPGGLEAMNFIIPEPPADEPTPNDKLVPLPNKDRDSVRTKDKPNVEAKKTGTTANNTKADKQNKNNGDGDNTNNNKNGKGGMNGLGVSYSKPPDILNYKDVLKKMVFPRRLAIRQIEDASLCVTCIIMSNGMAKNCEVSHGRHVPEFDQEALRLVSQMLFIPALNGDTKLDLVLKIPIPFVLQR